MADDSTRAETTADAARSSPVGDSAASTNAAVPQAHSIDTPQKDVVMPDAPIDNAAVRLSGLIGLFVNDTCQ